MKALYEIIDNVATLLLEERMIREIQSVRTDDDDFYFIGDYKTVVGDNYIYSITEHQPMGEGDRWYCDIEFENKVIRIFNIKEIVYVK